ncbi:MAG: PQQ-binding-like beta-propeller repeat protein [bacterium]|nr:PQQ-binding-like beta-propeller repeat protein [bacterium]
MRVKHLCHGEIQKIQKIQKEMKWAASSLFCVFCALVSFNLRVLCCASMLIVFANITHAEFSIGLPGAIKERIKKLDQRIIDQPLISSLTAKPTILAPAGTSSITCIAIDLNNASLIYTWTSNAGTITGSGSQITWTSPLSSGTYAIICKVSDDKGRIDNMTVDVAVVNQSPVINSLTVNPADVAPDGTAIITCTAYDPNGDVLAYTWASNAGTITGTGSQVAWIAPSSIGTYTVRCKVSDGKDGIIQNDIQVVVVMGVNHLPWISSLMASPSMLAPGSLSTITCTAYDPDNDPLMYTWTSNAGTITGTGSQVAWTSPLPDGTYTVGCEVSDNRGGTSYGSVSVVVENQSPVIGSLSAMPTTLAPGGTSAITCIAADANNDLLVYTWTCGTGTIAGSGSQVVWASPLPAGTYTISCEVSDGMSGTDSGSVAVVVINQAPVIGSLTAMPTTLAPGGTSVITCIATDPNNDAMSYTWTCAVGTITGTGSQVTWTAPLTEQAYTITCTVSDEKGEKTQKDIIVYVDGKVYWSFGTNDYIFSSPAIGTDGTIYVGSNDNKLYALNPNGTMKWSITTGGDVSSSPAIGTDGTIYVGSCDGCLYAITSNGSETWKFGTIGDISSSPAIGTDGTIYVGSDDNNLYALNPDGTERWNIQTGENVSSSPAIGTDGTIYVGSYDWNLYAIAPNGTVTWKFKTIDNSFIKSSPAIGTDGTIYIASWKGMLYAIAPNGSMTWSYDIRNYIDSSPVIGTDGTIYIGSWDNNLYAITPGGTKSWTFLTGNDVDSTPAIASDGTIYVGSSDNKIYAINQDGTKKWEFVTGDDVRSSPAIGADGKVYVGSYDGRFYAITCGSTLADTPWPMFHKNLQHTGRVE